MPDNISRLELSWAKLLPFLTVCCDPTTRLPVLKAAVSLFDLSRACDNTRRFDAHSGSLLCLIRLFSGNIVPCRRHVVHVPYTRACRLHTGVPSRGCSAHAERSWHLTASPGKLWSYRGELEAIRGLIELQLYISYLLFPNQQSRGWEETCQTVLPLSFMAAFPLQERKLH